MRGLIRICTLTLVAALALGTATLCQAQGAAVGRVAAKVVDEEGNPLAGVQITITCQEIPDYHHEATTNKKGKFNVSHVDGTKIYKYRFDLEGYQEMVEQVKPTPGSIISKEFVMKPPSADFVSEGGEPLTDAQNRAIMVYNEGAEAQMADNLDLAEKKYREALKIDEELAAAYSSLAYIEQARGNNKEAAALCEEALERDPTDRRALQIRYDAYRLAGDEEKAAEAAKALKASGGLSDAARRLFNEAAEIYNKGDVATAKAKFLEVIELDPEVTQVYGVLGILLLQDGETERALEMAEELLKRQPDDPQGLKVKYDAARILGKTDLVKDALDGLVVADPEWASHGLFDLGVNLFNSGATEQAATAFKTVLEVDPEHAKAHYYYALSIMATDQQEAGKYLRRFIELAPDDPDVAAAEDMLKYIP